MPQLPKKTRSQYIWTRQVSRVPLVQLEKHLDQQPLYKTSTIQLQRYQLCKYNLDNHKMRYRLLECQSPVCALGNECDAWIRAMVCQTTDVCTVDHHGSHAAGNHKILNRMTLELKRYTKDQAAQGARPMQILCDLVGKFKLTEHSTPTLPQVQRVAIHHRKKILMETALVSQMRETIQQLWFSVLDEVTPFTFATPTDVYDIPIIGNGSDKEPFITGVSTKRMIRGLASAEFFPLHIDGTHKTNQSGYTVVVVGTSDASRSIHVAAVFITSHLRQQQFNIMFSSLFSLYQQVTGSALKVRYVMGDADDAQYNGFAQIVSTYNPDATYLMCRRRFFGSDFDRVN